MLKGILVSDVPPNSCSGNTIHTANIASCLATFSEIEVNPMRFHAPLVGSAIHAVESVPRLLHHHFHYVWIRHSIGPLLTRVANIKGIVSICDVNSVIEARNRIDGTNRLMSRLNQEIELRNMASADTVRVHNNKLRDYFVSKYPKEIPDIEEKIRVIPIPFDVAECPVKRRYGSSSGSLVFVGSSQEWQGLEFLIRAFAKLRLTEVKLTLHTTTLPQTIRELIGELKIGDKIKVEFLPHRDLINALPSYDALVIPRPSNEVTNTSTPIKLVEAMACGLPIIGTNVGGISEYVEHKRNGYLVDPGSSGALAEGIARVIKNPKLARKMGENARLFAEETFDLPVISRQIESLLETESFRLNQNRKGTMTNLLFSAC